MCSIGLYIYFSTGFGALFSESLRQSDVVIEPVRDNRSKDYPFLEKRKKFDLDFQRQLKQHFPDWKARIDYQKKQEEFYKLAMKRRKELQRIRMIDKKSYYTKEELDAMDYFQGNGIYAKYQDKRETYNIFDTRQSFLLKMYNDKLRNDFLNNLNRRKN